MKKRRDLPQKAKAIGQGIAKTMGRVFGRLAHLAILLVLCLFTFVLAFTTFFFLTPQLNLSSSQVRHVLPYVLPASIDVGFTNFEIQLARDPQNLFIKHLQISARDLCVRYNGGEALESCFEAIRLGASAGWPSNPFTKFPELIQIDPVILLKGRLNADLGRFPKSTKAPSDDSFDMFDFVRTKVLPKWKVEGSRVEFLSLFLRVDAENAYQARFDLMTEKSDNSVRALVKEARAMNGAFRGEFEFKLLRPSGVTLDIGPKDGPRIWKFFANGGLQLKGNRSLQLRADADIESWQSLDYRVQARFKNIAAVKEIRTDGRLRNGRELGGRVSMQIGAASTQVRALDFVNCQVSANLDERTGSVDCGPQTVRLQLTEATFLRRPDLFTLHPEFVLKLTRLEFGKKRAADVSFDLNLNHAGVIGLRAGLTGHFNQSDDESRRLRFAIAGTTELAFAKFESLVELLRTTPYAVPAPINALSGRANLTAGIQMSEEGGELRFRTRTQLDSQHQAAHLELSGVTRIRKQISKNQGSGAFVTATDAKFLIDDLRFSAPRFDLRVPPRFNPDRRFGSLKEEQNKPPATPLDLRIALRTTRPGAIRIATNLTQAPIPIDINIVYDHSSSRQREEPAPSPLGAIALSESRDKEQDGSTSSMTTGARADVQLSVPKVLRPPKVTGSVVVGRVPVELFRRNALLNELRVDFLEDGDQRLSGQAMVSYLDYQIILLIMGRTSDPQFRFVSDPPLDSDQILAVLLFGRPLNELPDDQKASVGNLNAAFADAALGLSSLYLLASTPVESIGYDAERDLVTAKVGLGGGASLELGGGSDATAVGFKKRLTREFVFRSDVETIGTTGKRTVSALIEWVKRF